MTLPNSGAISINSLVGEYGGSAPHAMSEYYRGGGLVLNHSNNGGVPTSGQISLSQFYGQSNTPPQDNSVAGSFSSGSPTVNKFNLTQRGIKVSPAPGDPHMGSFNDSTITNSSANATWTVVGVYTQTSNLGDSGALYINGNLGPNGSNMGALLGYNNGRAKIGNTTYMTFGTSSWDSTNTSFFADVNLGTITQFPTSGNHTVTFD